MAHLLLLLSTAAARYKIVLLPFGVGLTLVPLELRGFDLRRLVNIETALGHVFLGS
jgi:hypothetical protein